MTQHRQPRTEAQAITLLERHAELEGHLAHIQGVRDKLIADANTNADAAADPLLQELEQLRGKLEPWWRQAGPLLTQGKRKSIELGGCDIGTRKAKDKLGIEGDEKDLATRLAKLDWAEQLIVTTPKLDKTAILKSIPGLHGKQLKRMGFSVVEGEDNFFVNRVKQGGTLAGADA